MNRLLFIFIICTITVAISCKKNSDPPIYNVEYKINTQADLGAFIAINYVDSTGVQVNGKVSGVTSFLKTTTVKTTPFNAMIGVKVVNDTTQEMDYDLVISVNGDVKKVVSGVTAPFSSNTTTAEYTIN